MSTPQTSINPTLSTVAAYAQLAATLAPLITTGIAGITMLIKRNDGGITTVTLLDHGDATGQEVLNTALGWLESHPQKTPTQ